MKMGISGRKIGLWTLGVVIAIQLVPVWLWQTNPAVAKEPKWDSPVTRVLAKRACFDCHSNETTWPIYTRIAPVSWWITNHVREGRERLNFSDWDATLSNRFSGRVLEEIGESVENGEMPMPSYLLIHADANLTPAEKQQLIAGLVRTANTP